MARFYSGKHGKSGSKKPLEKKIRPWIRYSKEEVEMLVVKFAKKNIPPSQIGMILRDSYGIPDVKLITGKKITKILEEHNVKLEIPEDLHALMRKYVKAYTHFEKHKKDMSAKRGLQLTESKIRTLIKYYKRVGKLPKEFVFNIDVAKKYSA